MINDFSANEPVVHILSEATEYMYKGELSWWSILDAFVWGVIVHSRIFIWELLYDFQTQYLDFSIARRIL